LTDKSISSHYNMINLAFLSPFVQILYYGNLHNLVRQKQDLHGIVNPK